MNKSIKQMWVLALKGGSYKQTKNQLSSKDAHCCLGVLCRLAVNAGVIERFPRYAITEAGDYDKDQINSYVYGSDEYNAIDTYLPEAVQAWAGLNEPNPDVRRPDVEDEGANLALLNDEGFTFAQIADVIEEQL